MSALGIAVLAAGVLMVGCWLVSLPSGRAWLMLAMVSAWGLRLSAHLAARKWGAPEDFRYQALRRRLQPFWLWSLLIVFGLQAALAAVVSLPVQAVLGDPDPSPLGWLDWVGAAVWAVGLAFESVGDEQLRRFKADAANRGTVMDRGLWRYSRHPNYFGDSMVWWGIWVVAMAAGAWWTVAGPLVMTILLLRVSGVTMLERSMGKRRPGYAEYAARTSTFVPMPPRRISR